MGPDCERYAPDFELPAYRHLPGVTPHPHRDPGGHRFIGVDPGAAGADPSDWRQNRPYLLGADLYNLAYWWEAHEQWEVPWRTVGAETGQFLQSLIQLAAALIKRHQGIRGGYERLSDRGLQQLAAVQSREGERFMGLDLPVFIACWQQLRACRTDAEATALCSDPNRSPLIRLRV